MTKPFKLATNAIMLTDRTLIRRVNRFIRRSDLHVKTGQFAVELIKAELTRRESELLEQSQGVA